MARLRAKGGSGPLSDYRIEDRWWRRANTKLGQPGIVGATNKHGLPVILKQWPRRDGVDDYVLAEIWHDEVRQLYRLVSYPGARDRLAILIESIEEPDSYTLVLASDERRPLQMLLDNGHGQYWFRHARALRNRLRLWQEIRRLVEGLEILHQQGLIHRNLDCWAVLTTAGTEPDFLLTGFEWSMRLTTSSVAAKPARQRSMKDAAMSFYDDWRALGVIAAKLLGFPSRAKSGEPYVPDISQSAEFLYAAERDLLTLLLTADPMKRIDGPVVTAQLDGLVLLLRANLIGNEPKLILALQTGRGSRLSEKIREASELRVGLNDEIEQQRFVAESLQDDPRLVRLKPSEPGAAPRYQLVGRKIAYELLPFLAPHSREESWSIARCIQAHMEPPPFGAIDTEISLDRWNIEFLNLGEAAHRFGNLQGKTSRWDQLLKPLPDDPFAAELAGRTYSALILVQVVEALHLAAEIWPVRITNVRALESNVTLELVSRHDPMLKALSDALRLLAPAVRLESALSTDQLPSDGEWKLSDEAGLGLRDSEPSTWRFTDIKEEESPNKILVFEGPGPAPIERELYLRFGGPGHDSLIRRRLKALKSLREHTELLGMITDPQGNRRPSHDPWIEDEIASGLDESKALALKEMWSVLPLYLVQGPPGVGKTRLVQELALKLLRNGRTERLLLTAQSHVAVDHLLEKVKEQLEGDSGIDMDQLLPLRCRPRDRDAGGGAWDLNVQAAAIAMRLAESEMARTAPDTLHANVQALERAFSGANGGVSDGGERVSLTDRSFEGLLLRSANLVFSSTNAAQLERLIEEQARFDWTIVEEAGKATGVELLSPLLLSHRRLLIGDHKQLPPFNSEQMLNFLTTPYGIKAAIDIGRPLLARQFGQLGMDDVLDRLADSDFDDLAPRARDLLLMFETMLTRELGDGPTSTSKGAGRRLEHQHRMHPAIARVVSEAFYQNAIRTDKDAERRFLNDAAPLLSIDPARLPDSPIVFVDMPFARAEVGMASPERKPRWVNRSEAELCCDVISLLRAREGHVPSLSVLSPYRAQVRHIDNLLADRMNDGGLANLASFKAQGDGFCGTVDSFQGNEADAVVISLVRNNHRVGPRALGFLANPKRMNVLISRARWRLILVGSWQFLKARFQPGEIIGPGHELFFLRKMMTTIDQLSSERDKENRPLACIIPASQIGGDAQ